METANKTITVETTVHAPIEKVWEYFTKSEHIVNWNFASDEWHSPKAENELKIGGKLKWNMAAKDGSFAFDFEGVYTHITPHTFIGYSLGDGRKVKITFESEKNSVRLSEVFEPESMNSIEMQQGGWQAILNNFKKYTESN